jgi:beta-hydroxylase
MFAAIIIGIFIISVIYAHSRGKEKQTLSRQLFDHSTFMAPINMFMTAFSSLPARQALRQSVSLKTGRQAVKRRRRRWL